MFILNNREQLQKAEEKAKQVKPKVKMIEFGRYLVSASDGGFYQVVCKKTASGEKQVSCSCKTKDGNVCYHSVPAIGLHIVLAEQKSNYN